LVKKIAVYGSYEAKVPVRQHYWIKGEDGVKRRVLKTTKRLKKVIAKGRYEFQGKGRDLYRAVIKAHRIMPKGYVDISAEEFLRHPEEYGYEGSWIDREIES
jgi:uncharacterized 2Fe-2S/4Fe-4S cluster protein (DUF4445 family)